MSETMCGCAACESWGQIHDAWARAAGAAETAEDEPPEPRPSCLKTGLPIPSWGPPLACEDIDDSEDA